MQQSQLDYIKMALITDPVSISLEKFVLRYGEQVIMEALKDGTPRNDYLIRPNPSPAYDSTERVENHTRYLGRLAKDLCKGHQVWKLLTIFRKLPTISHKFLEMYLNNNTQNSLRPIFLESMTYGTNVILKFSTNDYSLTNCNDRYNFTPSDAEMIAALRLMIYSILHRHSVFYLNSVSRRNLSTEISFQPLLESFNQRQEIRKKAFAVTDDFKDAIILPAFAGHIPPRKRTVSYNHAGQEFTIFLANYLPFPVESHYYYLRFKVLDYDHFKTITGLSFENWWRIWLSLNQVVKHNIVTLWTENEINSSSTEQFRGAVERADDFSDTGIGCGVVSSIVNTCHHILTQRYNDKAPNITECSKFIESLCCENLPGDPEFTEQPFLFYKISPERVFWDYLRHGAILRAIARQLFSGSEKVNSQIKSKAAINFETYIMNELDKAIIGAENFKCGVTIQDAHERTVWEIDIGFVYKRVLFLVEVKHWYKPVDYFFSKDNKIRNRTLNFSSILWNRDEKLRIYSNHAFSEWSASKIDGAICVVCTEDIEYIPSFERRFWLKTTDFPRILLVDEFINYLQTEKVEALYDHPKFVARTN